MQFKAGLYIRLSKEDKNDSIKNQKNLLIDYANNLNYEIKKIYVDDGYTGTNFNRPAFNSLLTDIQNKEINTVIVKDLSRLGRDYIKTGELVEHFFPINNIRFIAITDNIDTFLDNSNNDIAPFKAIINDLYAKDLSKKIKTAIKTMQHQGLWTGGCLPLGYQRNPKVKNKIIINPKEANIVKKIFELAYNKVPLSSIKNYLNNNSIPTFSKIRKNKETKWQELSIRKILTNPIYTGDLVQNKHQRLSYKYRKIINIKKENWIITPNDHPALVSKDKFNIIQTYLKRKKQKKEYNLLDNLLFCYECKHPIIIRSKNKYNKKHLCCNYYRANYQKKLCTAHSFNYETLEQDILNIVSKILAKIDYNILYAKFPKEKKLITKLINLEFQPDYLIKKLISEIEISQSKEVTVFFNFQNIT